jgi:hypothetical protein
VVPARIYSPSCSAGPAVPARASIKVAIDPARCLVCSAASTTLAVRSVQSAAGKACYGAQPVLPSAAPPDDCEDGTSAGLSISPIHACRTDPAGLMQKIGGPFFCMRNVLLMFGVRCFGVWCQGMSCRREGLTPTST